MGIGVLVATLLIAASSQSVIVGGMFCLSMGLPGVFLTHKALLSRAGVWYPMARLIAWTVAIAAGFSILGYTLFQMYLDQLGGIDAFIALILSGGTSNQAIPLPPEAQVILRSMAPYFPALFALSWMATVMTNGAMGQGIALRFKWAKRPKASLKDMDMPPYALMLLGICGGLSLVPGIGELGLNLFIIMLFWYLMMGLGVIHTIAGNRPEMGPFILSFTYVTLIIAFTIIAFPIIMLGIAEPWLNLRTKFDKKK